jgi:hypothetical protein
MLSVCISISIDIFTAQCTVPKPGLFVRDVSGHYQTTVDTMGPAWKAEQAALYEEKIRQIANERKLAEERRQNMLAQLEREEQLKTKLASEQQSLAMLLAMEQMDLKERQAFHAIKRENLNAVAESAQRDILQAAVRLDHMRTDARNVAPMMYANKEPLVDDDYPSENQLQAQQETIGRMERERQYHQQAALQALMFENQRRSQEAQYLTAEKQQNPAARPHQQQHTSSVALQQRDNDRLVTVAIDNLPPVAADKIPAIDLPAQVAPPKPPRRPSDSDSPEASSATKAADFMQGTGSRRPSMDPAAAAGIASGMGVDLTFPMVSAQAAGPAPAPAPIIPLKPPRAGSFLKQTSERSGSFSSAETPTNKPLAAAAAGSSQAEAMPASATASKLIIDTDPVAPESTQDRSPSNTSSASRRTLKIDRIIGASKDNLGDQLGGDSDDEFVFDASKAKTQSSVAGTSVLMILTSYS